MSVAPLDDPEGSRSFCSAPCGGTGTWAARRGPRQPPSTHTAQNFRSGTCLMCHGTVLEAVSENPNLMLIPLSRVKSCKYGNLTSAPQQQPTHLHPSRSPTAPVANPWQVSASAQDSEHLYIQCGSRGLWTGWADRML